MTEPIITIFYNQILVINIRLHRVKELQQKPPVPRWGNLGSSVFIIFNFYTVKNFWTIKMLISIVTVEECDATDDAIST
jgi:hypothetical protein